MDKRVNAYVVKFIRNNRGSVILSLLVTIVIDIICGIYASHLLKILIDKLDNVNTNWRISVFYIAGYTISLLSSFIGEIILRKINFFALNIQEMQIRNNLVQYIFKHSLDYYNSNYFGSINNNLEIISSSMVAIIDKVVNTISNIIMFILLFYIFLKTYAGLAYIFLVWLVIYSTIFVIMSRKLSEVTKIKNDATSKASGFFLDCLSNIFNIKAFARENYEKANIKKQNLIVLKTSSALSIEKSVFDLLSFVSIFLLLNSILITSFFLYRKGKITMGLMVFNITIISRVFLWVQYTIYGIIEVIELYSSLNNSFNKIFLDYSVFDYSKKELVVSDGNINISDISFQYKPELPFIFKKFSLTIPSHQKLGIVGYSGSGKSTLINLLLRFYDTIDGEIFIDGQNIKTDVTQKSLRNSISYIPQDPILFNRTLRENILYGKLESTEEELLAAINKASCHEFIMSLENKFYTLVGERGVKLSGGQKQRIAIARAILKNNKILVLDEATSALDSVTEKEIQIALNNLVKDKTVIIIAHRLATLDMMDRILAIDNGKIIEDGTKDELLSNQSGLFKKMWDTQKEGILNLY